MRSFSGVASGVVVSVLASTLGVVGIGVTPPASAAQVNVCEGGSTFCSSFDSVVTTAGTSTATTTAAAPVDVTVSASNTTGAGSGHANTQASWWHQLGLSLWPSTTGTPTVTPSASLADKAIVAGTRASKTSCTGSTLNATTCPAGFGSALIKVTGTTLADGTYSGTFGIQDIYNDRAGASAGQPWSYVADLTFSFNAGLMGTTSFTKSIAIKGAESAPGSGVPALAIPADGTATDVGTFSGDVDFSLDSLTLTLHGTATETLDQALTPSATAVRLPQACAPATALLSAQDRTTPSAHAVSKSFTTTTTGCPTVSAVSSVAGATALSVALDATGVAGTNPIDHYRWSFGDGTEADGDRYAGHTYSDASPRTVTVQAVDVNGARGAAASLALAGSKLTASQVDAMTLSGFLTDYAAGYGLANVEVRIFDCPTADTPVSGCTRIARPLTASDGRWQLHIPDPTAVQHLAFLATGGANRITPLVRLDAKPGSTLTLKTPAKPVRVKTSFYLKGSLRAPAWAGARVLIQVPNGSAWTTIARGRTTASSKFRIKLKALKKGTWPVRAFVAGDNGHLTAISSIRWVVIR